MTDYRFVGHFSEFLIQLETIWGKLDVIEKDGVFFLSTNNNPIAEFRISNQSNFGYGELVL